MAMTTDVDKSIDSGKVLSICMIAAWWDEVINPKGARIEIEQGREECNSGNSDFDQFLSKLHKSYVNRKNFTLVGGLRH